jgi:lysophospholipase L1-like esterase
MPAPPYAKVIAVINGGAPQSGGLTVPAGSAVQFVAESTIGWRQQRWELYEYPLNWPTPTGWSKDTQSGIIFSTAVTPQLITLPTSGGIWGKWLARLLVNEGVAGSLNPDLKDESTALSVLSVDGFEDIAAGEGSQFGGAWKRWIAAYQKNLRVSGGSTPSVTSISPNYAGRITAGVAVTITGSNFTGATGATIGGVALTSFVVVNSTTITGVTGAITEDIHNVVVTGPGGSGTLVGGYAAIATVRWYDPRVASSIDNAATIGQVNDLSGTGAHATQATGGAKPAIAAYLGRNWIRADSGKWLLIPSLSALTQSEVFALFSTDAALAFHSHWGTGDGTNDYLPANDGQSTYDGYGSTAWKDSGVAVATGLLNSPFLYNVVSAPNDWVNRVNGIQLAATNTNTVSFHANGMSWGASGANPAAPAIYYGGYLGELMITDHKVSTALRVAMHERISASWGTPHPYQAVCEGDSITAGLGVTTPYPAQMAASLGSGWVVVNNGVSSDTIENMLANAPTDIDPKYNAYAYKKNICVIFAGTNDLFFGETVDDTYGWLVSFCTGRRAVGYKVVVATTLPRQSVSVPQATWDARRADYNTRIRTNWASFADAIADVAADSRIGDDGDNNDTTYYQVDAVHPNDTGAGIIAGIIKTAVLSLA